jgi:glycosyltransferase involved in cell wall biosynthesis
MGSCVVTSEPTVSVLTTCYNREGFIGQAIESVLNSSFTDFEYIIVDDCSSDRSVEIAREYAKSDPRVKIYVNERNLGDYPNRSRAASLARGAYIKYVDSDDTIYPHCLQVMVECMERFPASGLGLSAWTDGAQPLPLCFTPAEAYQRHFFSDGFLINSPLSAIIRRDRFEMVGGFSGKRYVGDIELWLALARCNGVVLMPLGLTWWRNHGEQELTLQHRTFGHTQLWFEIQRAALQHPDCPLTRDEAAAALRATRLSHAKDLLGMAKRGHWRQSIRIAKSSGLGMRDFGRAIASRAFSISVSA